MDIIVIGVKIVTKWYKVKLVGMLLNRYLHEKGMELLRREIDL